MSAKPSKNTKYFIHSFIGIVVMFGFGLLPPFAPLTPLGMKYIGILLGLIYLWSLVEMLWPSIMALVAVILTGQFSGAAITPKAFGGDTIILVILSLAVIYALANTGMFNYVTNWLLSRKCFQGRPWILSGTLLVTMYLLAALSGGNMALLFLMWELIYKIADQIELPRTHPYCGSMVMGIIMAYVAGSCCLPFMPTYLFDVSLHCGDVPKHDWHGLHPHDQSATDEPVPGLIHGALLYAAHALCPASQCLQTPRSSFGRTAAIFAAHE